ncbi:MAG TPA: hemerythrin domain-containing protein [Steroidobacteraceae bacterium]|nr:hemerythrin domain-containing protein [Steroidobacteraceae bacterium]
MARLDEEASNSVNDALELLTRDHAIVRQLFEAFKAAGAQQLDPLARRICKMLRVHTQIEEELFYPIARRALGDDHLIDDAEREHAEAKRSILHVESMTSDHPEFQRSVEKLASEVEQHVQEEEGDIFPKLRESGIDLVTIGIALAERRDTLLDVLGLHNDDEEGAENLREIQAAAMRSRQSAADSFRQEK